MAEDDTRSSEKADQNDTEGHRFLSATPDDERQSLGRALPKSEDEDDTEGHRFTSVTPDDERQSLGRTLPKIEDEDDTEGHSLHS